MKGYFKKPISLIIFCLILSSFFWICDFSRSEDTIAASAVNPGDAPQPSQKETTAVAGELITVNFENIDISEVLRILSEKSHLNIVAGPDVKATVNLQLMDVPWEKALDVILRTYNLTYKKEPGLIRVMTLEQLKTEEEKVPLATKIIKLNFSKVEQVKASFSTMLSARGKIETDSRTNSIIVTDLPENIDKIEAIATQLDTRTPQVMVETMMADVKLVDQDQLGIQWKFARNASWASPSQKAKAVVEQGASLLPTNSALSFIFGQTILKDTDLTATLSLWQEQKRVNILAHPQIMTLDNDTAHIELTEQIPYTQQTQSTQSSSAISSTAFKDSGIKLDVTPHITTKDNFVSMNLKVEQSFLSGFTPDNQPIIDSRKAETNLLVKDGETIVIGGLRKKEDTTTYDKVPFLGDLPLFGPLFRKKVKSVTDIDLLIFVTPRIITESRLTEKEISRLKLFAAPEDKKGESFKRTSEEQLKPIQEKEKFKEEEGFTLRPPG